MAFTYDPTLVDDISKVRFHIGDTVENTGPRATTNDASKSNFLDEEITAILNERSGNVDQTIATLLGTLATDWTRLAISVTMGPYKEELWRVAERFQKQADEWKEKSGLGTKAFSSGVIRRNSADTGSVT